jgi:hypothetical protein
MEKLLTIILSVVAVMALILLVAVFGGVLVWWLWPIVIPAVFPGAVASGLVAKDLSLVTSIALSWLVGILFKSSSVSRKE